MDVLLVAFVLFATWFVALFLASILKGKFPPKIGVFLLICGSLAGVATFLFAGFIESNWNLTGIFLSKYEESVYVFPIIEELSKLLFIIVLFLLLAFTSLSPKKRSRPHLLLLGAGIGLGFAFTESLSRIATFSIVRGVAVWPIHILAATILAVGIAVVFATRNRSAVLKVLAAACLAIFVHAAFNYFIILSGLR